MRKQIGNIWRKLVAEMKEKGKTNKIQRKGKIWKKVRKYKTIEKRVVNKNLKMPFLWE